MGFKSFRAQINDESVDEILVPTASGPPAELAAEIARAIPKQRPRAYRRRGRPADGDRSADQDLLTATAEPFEYVKATAELPEVVAVIEMIVERRAGYDISVIKPAREGLLHENKIIIPKIQIWPVATV